MNRKLKTILYSAGIFVAGIVAGVFISYQIARHMMPSREKMAAHWIGELESKLSLTPEQAQKIRPIVDATLVDFKNSLSQELLASVSNCNAQIAAQVTPEQKTKLAQFQKDQEEFIRTKIGGEKSSAQKNNR